MNIFLKSTLYHNLYDVNPILKSKKLISLTKNMKGENERLSSLVITLQDELDKRSTKVETVEPVKVEEKPEIAEPVPKAPEPVVETVTEAVAEAAAEAASEPAPKTQTNTQTKSKKSKKKNNKKK